ncbi:MAG: hypothetical protein VX705_05945 [Verrucomicrobiota bacterium]|nr:hypothetical protein [Verrucomicrobiota bacterium]
MKHLAPTLRSRGLALLTATAMLLPGCGKKDKEASDAAEAAKSDDPDVAVKAWFTALANNQPEVMWGALSPDVQKDINDIVRQVGAQIDQEVFTNAVAVLNKLNNVIKSKKTMIPGVVQQISQGSSQVNAQEVTGVIDIATALLTSLLASDLVKASWLKNPDVGKLLKDSGGPLLQQIRATIKQLNPEESANLESKFNKIKNTQVKVLKNEDGTAEVEVTIDNQTEKVNLKKMDGVWKINLTEEQKKGLAGAKMEISSMGALMGPQQKNQALQILNYFHAILPQFQSAQNAEQLTGMTMGAATQLAPFLENMGGSPNATGPGKTSNSKTPSRDVRWQIGTGKQTDLDRAWLNQPASVVLRGFGQPDAIQRTTQGDYWLYKNLTIIDMRQGGRLTSARFRIVNNKVIGVFPVR